MENNIHNSDRFGSFSSVKYPNNCNGSSINSADVDFIVKFNETVIPSDEYVINGDIITFIRDLGPGTISVSKPVLKKSSVILGTIIKILRKHPKPTYLRFNKGAYKAK